MPDWKDWIGTEYLEVIASRDNADEADANRLADVLIQWLAGGPIPGGTVSIVRGVWQGAVEYGVRVEVVASEKDAGLLALTQIRLVRAAHSAGCNAVQVTSIDGDGGRVTTEHRPA